MRASAESALADEDVIGKILLLCRIHASGRMERTVSLAFFVRKGRGFFFLGFFCLVREQLQSRQRYGKGRSSTIFR